MAGYSPRPLRDKLGIKPGQRIRIQGAPAGYAETLGIPDGVRVVDRLEAPLDLVQLFVEDARGLARELPRAKRALAPAGALWISWPKKASGIATDVTEDTVRAAALAAGLVDVKVCAVDDVWSGLKLVYRTADRAAVAATARRPRTAAPRRRS